METKKIYLHALQNMEHFQFASHVAALCDETNFFSFLTYLPPTFPNRESIHPSLYPPRQRRHK